MKTCYQMLDLEIKDIWENGQTCFIDCKSYRLKRIYTRLHVQYIYNCNIYALGIQNNQCKQSYRYTRASSRLKRSFFSQVDA